MLPLWRESTDNPDSATTLASDRAATLHLRLLARPVVATQSFPSLRSLLLAHTPLHIPAPTHTDHALDVISAPSTAPPAWSALPVPVPVVVAGAQGGLATHVRIAVRQVVPGACVCAAERGAAEGSKGCAGARETVVNEFARFAGVVGPISGEGGSLSARPGCGRAECMLSEQHTWRALGSDTDVGHCLPRAAAAATDADTETVRMGAAEQTWLAWGVRCASVPASWSSLQRLQCNRYAYS